GFGEHAAQRILENLQSRQSKTTRFTLAFAAGLAGPLLAWLKDGVPDAVAEVAGSFRRCQETVGDLDIVAHARHPGALIERFVQFPDVQEVRAHGGTRASVLLRQGIQVDLRVVPAASYGAAMHYFTGSKSHNIALRRLAQDRGWKLNEYGLYAGDERIAGATEHSIFAALGLDDIPPELRENRGEIDAARAHRLPHLVARRDLRGDLHLHTKASDGRDSLRAMALAARDLGLSYIAVTEHSQRLRVAHGLDAAALGRQREEVDRLNAELEGISILHGVEVDILADGSLDLPDEVLAGLDLVIGAVHADFSLPRAEQTRRILRAMDHPAFTMLAHPTGRLLLERDAYDVDLAQVLRHARQRGCCIEVNAQPNRLDLDDVWCRLARDEGVTLCINSDAHSAFDFAHLDYGIGQARRGWIERSQVLNALPLPALRKRLREITAPRRSPAAAGTGRSC
ncbi:MAG TPA: PHP domain-containing protein, partial [Telluria sp.]|nr:PHP domain-containing protein [Telluria sp.]